MVYTRLDIAFVLGKLSQHMANPAEYHMTAVKNLIRYLCSTISHRIKYSYKGSPQLILYSDTD
jgi:hypothetical protein